MTRTEEDLRHTFARHAQAPTDATARLQVVVDKLSQQRTGGRPRRRRSPPLLVSAAVVAVIAVTVVAASNHRTNQTQVLAGSASTPFSLPSAAGKTEYSFPADQRQVLQPLSGPKLGANGATLRLSDFSGKVVVINVWGSWCTPCKSEKAPLKAAYTQLSPAGVQFLGIDVKDNAAGAEAAGTPYPSIFDSAQTTSVGTLATSVPMTIVLDKQHRVAHLWLQPVTQASLIDVVRALLAEN